MENLPQNNNWIVLDISKKRWFFFPTRFAAYTVKLCTCIMRKYNLGKQEFTDYKVSNGKGEYSFSIRLLEKKNVSNLLPMHLCLEYLQIHVKQNVLCGCIFQYKAVGTKLIRWSRIEVKMFLIYPEKSPFYGHINEIWNRQQYKIGIIHWHKGKRFHSPPFNCNGCNAKDESLKQKRRIQCRKIQVYLNVRS